MIQRTLQISAIVVGLWAVRAPVGGILIALWGSSWLILAPLAVVFGYTIAVASMFAWKRVPPRLALAISAILLALSLVGLFIDFTTYGQPAPGLWEWVNGMSPIASTAILFLVFGNNRLVKKTLREVSPGQNVGGYN